MSIKSRITLFFALIMLVIEALVLTFIMVINGNVVTNNPERRLVQVMEANLNRVTFTDQEFQFDKVKYYTKGVYSALSILNGTQGTLGLMMAAPPSAQDGQPGEGDGEEQR